MQVKEITVTIGRKAFLGNFSTGTVEITLTGSVVEDDDAVKVIDHLKTVARDAVIEELLRMPREVSGPGVTRTDGITAPASNAPQKATLSPPSAPVAAPPFQPTGSGELLC